MARKLLGLKDELQAVQGLLASAGTVARDIPSVERVSEAYTRGPFHWPPYDSVYSSCPFGTKMAHVTYEVFSVLATYYIHWNSPRSPIDRSLRAALPKIQWNSSIVRRSGNVTTRKTWSSYVFHGLLGLTGSTPPDTLVFFKGTEPWTLRWIWATATVCDLASVQSCSGHKRDLVMSIFVFVLLYFMLVALGNALGVPYMSFAFVLASPVLLLWYVYGMSFSCLPLLPTCLLEDVIHAGRQVLPGTIYFPKKLLCDESLHNASFIPPERACLKSCDTLGFTGWTEPIAFALCDLDAHWCAALANFTFNASYLDNGLGPLFRPFKDSLTKFHPVVAKPDVHAYRVCAWVTGVTAVPFAALLVSVGLLAGSVILGFVQLGPVFFSMVAQSVAYHRTR